MNSPSTVTFGIAAYNGCYYSAQSMVTVAVADAPPTGVDYSGSTPFETELTFTPTLGGGPATAGITLTSQPSHGVASASGTTITYTPASGYYGPDSFGWQAEGPGGGTGTKAANITVQAPALPTLSGGSLAVPFNQSKSLNMSPTSGGVLSISTPAGNGAVSFSGGTVTYTAGTDYIGLDEFYVVATNIIGPSAPQRVSVVVAPPAAPVVSNASANTTYQTATSVNLTPTGLWSSLSVQAGPANGSVTIAGDRATYTPANGFIGQDSFTFLATGLGGPSNVATVTLDVAAPGVPAMSGAALTTIVDKPVTTPLAPTGVFASVVVDQTPDHGQVVVVGTGEATYTPDPGYVGSDTFSLVAIGPGGPSAPAIFPVDVVAPPPPPPQQPAPETESPSADAMRRVGPQGAPMLFRVAAGRPNVTAVELVTQPSVGSAQVQGLDVVYQPPADFTGSQDFDYRLKTAKGMSTPAKLTAVVTPIASAGPEKVASAWAGKPITLDLFAGSEGGPFVGAVVVSVTPASAADVVIVETAPGRLAMMITPRGQFHGDVIVDYRLARADGATADGRARLTFNERPDPSRDPEVTGLVNAQAQAANRFGSAQIANVNRRLEAVRDGRGRGASMSLSLASTTGREPELGAAASAVQQEREVFLNRNAGGSSVEAVGPDHAGLASKSSQAVQQFGVWAGGVLELGSRKASGSRGGFDFNTSGVSGGADVAVSDKLVVGGGAGFGIDKSDVGDNGTRSEATSVSAFLYGSYSPLEQVFIDGVIGASKLDFESRRFVTNTKGMVTGKRSGDQFFGSLSAGYAGDWSGWRLSPYGRLEYLMSELGGFTEQGDDTFALRFRKQTTDQLTGALGLRGEYDFRIDRATLSPTFRAEYRLALSDAGKAEVSYADWLDSPLYQIGLSNYDNRRFLLGLGMRWTGDNGWSVSVDADSSVADTGGNGLGLRVSGNGKF